MRVVALVSGGKDSCYNMMQCVGAGHIIVALANLKPQEKDELDSYMYQTVGHQGIDLYAEAMGLPMYRAVIKGIAIDQERLYKPTENDEVEDLYNLLLKVKEEMNIEAVAVGAILSDYQRIRVENVCNRLNLISLAYLWRRNQKELLREMISSGVEAIIIKVAALGLDPRVHLGMSLREIQPHLLVMQEKYGLNVCGEGGEYETFTLDCPLFKQRLVIDKKDVIMHSDDPVAPVGYLNLSLHLEPKDNLAESMELLKNVKSSADFVNELNDSVFSDLSDLELSETELESIEMLKHEQKKKDELSALSDTLDASDTSVDGQNRSDTSEEGFYYDKHGDCVNHPLEDHSSIHGNKHGWYFIGGLVGTSTSTAEATQHVIDKLFSLLSAHEMGLPDVCSVNIYMRDMSDYKILNKVYLDAFNFSNPPTRVCVQCPLPVNVQLVVDAVAHKTNKNTYKEKERSTMHVQGISHWAPANIGPYSQAVKVGEVIGTCGQIALVPGAMQLVDGGATRECSLALRHLTRVIRATHPRAHIRCVFQSVCYMTQGSVVSEARRQLERRTAGAIVQYAVVDALPLGATIEWHAWAHTDNNRFEYEETGCNVGEYRVAITRRWNYENTVAAFVCYVATGSSPSTCRLLFPNRDAYAQHRALASVISQCQIETVLEYALKKLLNECHRKEPNPSVKMRIFYQVWSAPPASVIVKAASAVRDRICPGVAFTIVPVTALHNAFTFMSISGLRIDE